MYTFTVDVSTYELRHVGLTELVGISHLLIFLKRRQATADPVLLQYGSLHCTCTFFAIKLLKHWLSALHVHSALHVTGIEENQIIFSQLQDTGNIGWIYNTVHFMFVIVKHTKGNRCTVVKRIFHRKTTFC